MHGQAFLNPLNDESMKKGIKAISLSFPTFRDKDHNSLLGHSGRRKSLRNDTQTQWNEK